VAARGAAGLLIAISGALVAPAALAHPAAPKFGPAIEGTAGYDGQSKCDPTPKPGVLVFQALVLKAYPGTGAGSISRDCSSGGTSEHKEGRAWDWGVNVSVPSQKAAAEDLIDWLLAKDKFGNEHALARRVGIMYLIWNRRIWEPWGGWETYCVSKAAGCVAPGTKSDVRNPHTDHVHFSFTWAGARKQTSFWAPERSMITGLAGQSTGLGYWLAGANGAVYGTGAAWYMGSKSDVWLEKPVADLASTPSGAGYWLVTTGGRLFAFGDAVRKGDRSGEAGKIEAIAPTPTGTGYWLMTRSGKVFAFGKADGYGHPEGSDDADFSDIVPTPTGLGYWLVQEDGRVFAFGDATHFGDAAEKSPSKPIVAAASHGAGGYWLVTSAGRVFAFGDAPTHGGLATKSIGSSIVGITATPSGDGYWLVTAKGKVYDFGAAAKLV
jgi:hypothetical protein